MVQLLLQAKDSRLLMKECKWNNRTERPVQLTLAYQCETAEKIPGLCTFFAGSLYLFQYDRGDCTLKGGDYP